MKIEIDKIEFLEMLEKRVERWIDEPETVKLFMKMYKNYNYEGFKERTINEIVDNDCVNWCGTINKDDEGFKELLKIYKKQGLGDCSCESDLAKFIEAVDNEKNPKVFLITY